MTKIKVCLDPGHCASETSGGDPGAVSGKYKESVAALAIAKKVKQKLEAAGYAVKMTRTGGNKDLTLAKRCKISNEWGADLFVSIHLNSVANPEANGIETLRYPKVGTRTKALANNMQSELIAATGLRNRGVKERSDLYVLKHTTASAVLLEVGFISNANERKLAFSSSFQNKVADAILKAVQKTV